MRDQTQTTTQGAPVGAREDGGNGADVAGTLFPKGGTDEQIKVAVGGGPDLVRSYASVKGRTSMDPDKRPALEHFFYPSAEQMRARADQIAHRLEKHAYVIIPMKEDTDVVGHVLDYATQYVPGDRIIVANCKSGDAATTAVSEFFGRGVRLVNMDEMLDCLDWQRLLPVLGLDERPSGGKGLTMLAGMLAMRALHPEAAKESVIQHDADVRYDMMPCYHALGHLAFPLADRAACGDHRDLRYRYVKITRGGRGNETCMSFRNLLGDIATHPATPANVRRVAHHLWMVLTEHKWMLTGEFGMLGRIAFNRPFATRYWEETLMSIWVESCIEYRKNGHPEAIAQVETHSPRVDACNDDTKEFLMQDGIGRFMRYYVWFGKPITDWTMADYQRFNAGLVQLEHAARIPSRSDDERGHGKLPGPVIRDSGLTDRIIPSVQMLHEQNFVFQDRLDRVIHRLAG